MQCGVVVIGAPCRLDVVSAVEVAVAAEQCLTSIEPP